MKPALIPHSIEAEQSVLGSILLDHDSLLQAVDHIGPEDFYRQAHQVIFNACLEIYGFGDGIDIVSLMERLKLQNKLDMAGGLEYLIMLANFVSTFANVNLHARIVKEKATLRRAMTWAEGIARQIGEGSDCLDTLLPDIEHGLNELLQTVRPKKSPYISSILDDIHKAWEDIRSGTLKYIPTDYKFSALIPGYFQHLWMIGGYTSNGKSSLLAQIVADGCEEGIKPLIFSLEDSRNEKTMKLISNIADISQRDLMTGEIEGRERDIRKAEEIIRQWSPIIYDDVYTIDEIRLKAKKHKMQDDINMICIDYVQNIQGPGDLYQTMRDASIQMDHMKKELQCTVIALSQITNDSAKTKSDLIALKGAGELASAADIVLWLNKVNGEGKEHWLDCIVRKNRPFGTIGLVPLIFSDRWSRIDKRGM